MPTYDFRLKDDPDNIITLTLSLAEREKLLKDPNVEQCLSCPSIGDPVRLGFRKPDEGFRDKLREMKKKHKYNTINVL